MKKDEMVTVLAVAGVEPKIIDALTLAYDMGFDYGSKAYVFLTEAVEEAKRICEQLDSVGSEPSTADFWKAMKKLQELE